MNINDAMEIVYPMKYLEPNTQPNEVKKTYFCTHWESSKACFYSMMHRCKEESYGCEFEQN